MARCDLGVIGLATMGANLARNAARKGCRVAVQNRNWERTETLVHNYGHEGYFTPARSLSEFVNSLSKPRTVIMMVQAGKPVDELIDELGRLLEPGDILVDAGNSLFSDPHGARRAAAQGLRYLGMGVSGGEEGALVGPSMMPGGDREAYAHIESMMTRMAAQVDGTPCCRYIGPDGPGTSSRWCKRHRIRRHATDRRSLRSAAQPLWVEAAKIADIFAGWKEGDRFLSHRNHGRGPAQARRADRLGPG